MVKTRWDLTSLLPSGQSPSRGLLCQTLHVDQLVLRGCSSSRQAFVCRSLRSLSLCPVCQGSRGLQADRAAHLSQAPTADVDDMLQGAAACRSHA